MTETPIRARGARVSVPKLAGSARQAGGGGNTPEGPHPL